MKVMEKYTPSVKYLSKGTKLDSKHKKSKSTIYNHLRESRIEKKQERKEKRVMTKTICQLSKALEQKNLKLDKAALEMKRQKKKYGKVQKLGYQNEYEVKRRIETLQL